MLCLSQCHCFIILDCVLMSMELNIMLTNCFMHCNRMSEIIDNTIMSVLVLYQYNISFSLNELCEIKFSRKQFSGTNGNISQTIDILDFTRFHYFANIDITKNR